MTPSELTGLLERVREAKGPDRMLDAEIRLALPEESDGQGYLGNKAGMITSRRPGGRYGTWLAPRYTASVDLCIALAEHVLPGASITVQKWSDGAHASIQDQRGGHGSNGAAPALALLAAILSALLAKLNPGEAG